MIKVCAKKIDNSAKFINFFAHDILDYSQMNESASSFTQNLSVVNIKNAIAEIYEI